MTNYRDRTGRSRRGRHLITPIAAVAVAALVASCGGGEASTAVPEIEAGSFAKLQSAVFTPSCATSGCHVGSSVATSGNLNLSAGQSYQNLVNVVASHPNAKRDGFRRVLPFKPESSLLYQKVLVSGGAHGGDYGNVMPVGTPAISIGQLEFIRQWIAGGAPKSGDVATESLLSDKTAQTTAAFVPLAAPAAGAGFQIRVDPFTVSPNFERELFVYRALNNAAPVYVSRIETANRTYSHHFVLYSVDASIAPFACPPPLNTVRDIRRADGTMDIGNMLPMACHVFLGGSMTERGDYSFPPGVALELPANMSIDMNVHYANRTSGTVPGESYANLYTVPASQVQKVAHTLNWSMQNEIVIPPNKDTTISKTFTVSKTTTIFGLTSHMHARGTRFQIRIVGGARDGELVYESTDWEHPAMLNLTTPIVLSAGQGLRSTITWHNTSAQTVRFGLLSTDEMGIIFGYYY